MRAWQGEYVELQDLLPARLGAPIPTVFDALTNVEKVKHKKSIESIETIADWALCFNTYTSLMAIQKPERVHDMLAYSSIILKASQEYTGNPWLEYDVAFRRQAASKPDTDWAQVDASLWTTIFSKATPKSYRDHPVGSRSEKQGGTRSRSSPYPSHGVRICFKWNSQKGCDLVNCRFLHVCSRCQDPDHVAFQCPKVRPPGQKILPQGSDRTQNFRPPLPRPTDSHSVATCNQSFTIVPQSSLPSNTSNHCVHVNQCYSRCMYPLVEQGDSQAGTILGDKESWFTDDIDMSVELEETLLDVSESLALPGSYSYTTDLLKLEKCLPNGPSMLPEWAQQITTPLCVDQWRVRLAFHPDQQFAQYLIQGIQK